jgi:hypothetical protein
MISEWMRIMLDEMARKKAAAEAARLERDRRIEERPQRRDEQRPKG